MTARVSWVTYPFGGLETEIRGLLDAVPVVLGRGVVPGVIHSLCGRKGTGIEVLTKTPLSHELITMRSVS